MYPHCLSNSILIQLVVFNSLSQGVHLWCIENSPEKTFLIALYFFQRDACMDTHSHLAPVRHANSLQLELEEYEILAMQCC